VKAASDLSLLPAQWKRTTPRPRSPLIYARLGQSDDAITMIKHLLTVPAELHPSEMHAITLAELKWPWVWAPLRREPRFQKILAGPEPKTIY
jgi:hypothetical protein